MKMHSYRTIQFQCKVAVESSSVALALLSLLRRGGMERPSLRPLSSWPSLSLRSQDGQAGVLGFAAPRATGSRVRVVVQTAACLRRIAWRPRLVRGPSAIILRNAASGPLQPPPPCRRRHAARFATNAPTVAACDQMGPPALLDLAPCGHPRSAGVQVQKAGIGLPLLCYASAQPAGAAHPGLQRLACRHAVGQCCGAADPAGRRSQAAQRFEPDPGS